MTNLPDEPELNETRPQRESKETHPPVPGPGLPEALMWTLSVLPVQIVAMIAALVVVGLLFLTANGLEEALHVLQNLRDPQRILQLAEVWMVPFFAAAQIATVLIAAGLVALRLGKPTIRRLSLFPLRWVHVGQILLLVLPLALLSGQLMFWTTTLWEATVDFFPVLAPVAERLEEVSTTKTVEMLAEKASLPLLLVILALSPAIWEELIFRGVIGRGLVARWGVLPGVLMTSVLFAVVHIHPAHALALIPLAIAMHLLYLATKSFWAPVLVHFLNNSFAAVVQKCQESLKIEKLAENDSLPPLLLITASFCVVATAAWVWQTRVQYVYPDGTPWNPGYVTAEKPPRQSGIIANQGHANGWLIAAVIVAFVAFIVAFAAFLVAMIQTG